MPSRTVLLVDDDPFIPGMLAVVFRRAGHRLVDVSTMAAARAAIRAAPPDLIILDLYLPDGKGYDLLRHVRVDLGATIPIIVLSGLKQADAVLRAVDEGANDYVQKPFSPRDVAVRVENAMRTAA